MMVRVLDYQDKSSAIHGRHIDNQVELAELLDSVRTRAPFLVEFEGENGYILLVGIGGPVGCVQHSRADGELPYLMALTALLDQRKGYVEFLCCDTPTPVPLRETLPFEKVKEIVMHFQKTGARCPTVTWGEIGPIEE